MNPQNQNDQDIRELLKQTISSASHTELRRDLWPQMLEKLSRQPVHFPLTHVHWFDWVLAALAGAALLAFPGILPALFYHL
jgi:hypothetical protein